MLRCRPGRWHSPVCMHLEHGVSVTASPGAALLQPRQDTSCWPLNIGRRARSGARTRGGQYASQVGGVTAGRRGHRRVGQSSVRAVKLPRPKRGALGEGQAPRGRTTCRAASTAPSVVESSDPSKLESTARVLPRDLPTRAELPVVRAEGALTVPHFVGIMDWPTAGSTSGSLTGIAALDHRGALAIDVNRIEPDRGEHVSVIVGGNFASTRARTVHTARRIRQCPLDRLGETAANGVAVRGPTQSIGTSRSSVHSPSERRRVNGYAAASVGAIVDVGPNSDSRAANRGPASVHASSLDPLAARRPSAIKTRSGLWGTRRPLCWC